ncbi:MAG: STAS domain-containing protein [Rhodocyclaceae bacterium]|nr:STAS domain-containing protein [Rhodocyclaceae bacterium]
MIQSSGDQMQVIGPMTIARANQLISAGNALIDAGAVTVDLSQVTDVDSASLAILFDWCRTAPKKLTIRHLPEAMRTLAQLYGVVDLIPQPSPSPQLPQGAKGV